MLLKKPQAPKGSSNFFFFALGTKLTHLDPDVDPTPDPDPQIQLTHIRIPKTGSGVLLWMVGTNHPHF
jgi:hypothetical protein